MISRAQHTLNAFVVVQTAVTVPAGDACTVSRADAHNKDWNVCGMNCTGHAESYVHAKLNVKHLHAGTIAGGERDAPHWRRQTRPAQSFHRFCAPC